MIKNRKLCKIFKIVLIFIGILIVVVLLSFIPTLRLKTNGMKTFKGEYVTVYYEKEESAAKDVFALAETEGMRIANTLGFDSPQGICIYIYDSQSTFQTKKYGLIALLLNLDWYIGDNRGTNVLLTSPADSGSQHSYDELVNEISVHEMVHAYNSLINPNMILWLNEGLAGYLSDQVPQFIMSSAVPIPTIEQMQTSNPVQFSKMGGYQLSYTYIEYLNDVYGWESVQVLAQTNDYVQAFDIEEDVIYKDWIDYLYRNYSQ